MLLRRGDARLEMLPHRDKGARIGALEAVDRLLGVADRENRAVALARHAAFAGEKLLGERRDDRPLVGVRVLRLVDQDVVEPAIELEQHPGRDAGAAQQLQRLQHEVVVIQRPVQPLAAVVGMQYGSAEPDQRAGRLGQRGGRAQFHKAADAVGLGIERGTSIAAALLGRRPVGDQALADLAPVVHAG